MNKHKLLTIKALEQMRGDDLERIKISFRNFTPEQMKEQYGLSGKTHQEILDRCVAYNAEINETIDCIKRTSF